MTERSVETLIGSQTITLLAGRRVLFAYPGEDFYANVKVEILRKENCAAARATLSGAFESLLL